MGFDGEQYEKDGKLFDRVTKIINHFAPPELVDYRVRVGNREANSAMRKAGKFGSMVDEAIRLNWLSPSLPKKSEERINALSAWESWKKDHMVYEIGFPETYFSEAILVAGTPDFTWGNMIVDIKCSARVSPFYFAQLGAYAFLSGKSWEDLAVLRLDKSTGLYEFVKASTLGFSVADCINWFNALLINYRNYKQVQCTLKGKGLCNDADNDW